MVGNEVHHDHSLAAVYEAKDAHEVLFAFHVMLSTDCLPQFFEKRLHANQDKLLGLLKTYA